MTLCSTTESNHSMKDSTVAFFLSSSFSSWKTVTESSAQNGSKHQRTIHRQKNRSSLLTSADENKSCGFLRVTLRVDVRIGVSASGHTQQRLRADAAQVHFVDVRHHAGHHSLVEQSRTCNLESDGGRQLLLGYAVPVLCAPCGLLFFFFYLSQVQERGLPLQG